MASFFSDALQKTYSTLQYCTSNFRLNDVIHSTLLCATHIAIHSKSMTTDLRSPLSLPQSHTGTHPAPPPETWPHVPFTTNDTQILNALSEPVVFAGVNWPAHGKAMVPEGLQHQSIRQIVSRIKSLGMNVVRLTYATEMVDDIFDRGGVDVSLPESLVRGLGYEEGKRVYREIVMRNPEFGNWRTTRFDVLDAVAEELANQHIYLHLDNHISKAGWCCSLYDENGWFNDTYFSPHNWTRGLNFMSHRARHSRNWRGLTSISLRNEPRDTPNNPRTHATYNWSTWYDYMVPAATTLHAVNPDPLIFVSGLNFDTELGPIVRREDLNSPQTDRFAYQMQWHDGQNRDVREIVEEGNEVLDDSNLNSKNRARPKTHNPLSSLRLKGERIVKDAKHKPPRPHPRIQTQIQTRSKNHSTPQPEKRFNLTSFPFSNKLVFELHTYRLDITNCTAFKHDLAKAGYGAMIPSSLSSEEVVNKAPVVLTEFGFPQSSPAYLEPYAQCLRSFLPEVGGGWMYWVLAGSYYERDGVLGYDETWGLLDREWQDWRSRDSIEFFRAFVNDSLTQWLWMGMEMGMGTGT